MITRISGTLERVEPTAVEIGVGPVVHEVLVTELVRRSLQQKLGQPVPLSNLVPARNRGRAQRRQQ